MGHKGSPRILEWVAYPFSRGLSLTQNRGLLHRRGILYQLSYHGSPIKGITRIQTKSSEPQFSHSYPSLHLKWMNWLLFGLPWCLTLEKSVCSVGDPGLIPEPWFGKIPWRRKWQLTLGILAWKIPRMELPDRLHSMGSQRVRHDWVTFI